MDSIRNGNIFEQILSSFFPKSFQFWLYVIFCIPHFQSLSTLKKLDLRNPLQMTHLKFIVLKQSNADFDFNLIGINLIGMINMHELQEKDNFPHIGEALC